MSTSQDAIAAIAPLSQAIPIQDATMASDAASSQQDNALVTWNAASSADPMQMSKTTTTMTIHRGLIPSVVSPTKPQLQSEIIGLRQELLNKQNEVEWIRDQATSVVAQKDQAFKRTADQYRSQAVDMTQAAVAAAVRDQRNTDLAALQDAAARLQAENTTIAQLSDQKAAIEAKAEQLLADQRTDIVARAETTIQEQAQLQQHHVQHVHATASEELRQYREEMQQMQQHIAAQQEQAHMAQALYQALVNEKANMQQVAEHDIAQLRMALQQEQQGHQAHTQQLVQSATAAVSGNDEQLKSVQAENQALRDTLQKMIKDGEITQSDVQSLKQHRDSLTAAIKAESEENKMLENEVKKMQIEIIEHEEQKRKWRTGEDDYDTEPQYYDIASDEGKTEIPPRVAADIDMENAIHNQLFGEEPDEQETQPQREDLKEYLNNRINLEKTGLTGRQAEEVIQRARDERQAQAKAAATRAPATPTSPTGPANPGGTFGAPSAAYIAQKEAEAKAEAEAPKVSFAADAKPGDNYVPPPPQPWQERIKEADSCVFEPFPSVPKFTRWWMNFRKIVASSFGKPDLAFIWISEIEDAKSLEDLKDSGPLFESLDAKIAAGLSKILHGEFAREVQVHEEAAALKRTLFKGRQVAWLIRQHFKQSEVDAAILEKEDILTVELKGDNLRGFMTDWNRCLLAQRNRPEDEWLEALFGRQIEKSEQLSQPMALYKQDVLHNGAEKSYAKLLKIVTAHLEDRRKTKVREGNARSHDTGTRTFGNPVKTVPGDCRSWVNKGACPRGDDCSYDHPESRKGIGKGSKGKGKGKSKEKGKQRGRSTEREPRTGNGRSRSGSKTDGSPSRKDDKPRGKSPSGKPDRLPCTTFSATGKCSFGDKCNFWHVPLCKNLKNGGTCPLGKRCMFRHPPNSATPAAKPKGKAKAKAMPQS